MKKIIFIVLAIIIIVGIVLTATIGLNVDIIYKNHEQIKIYIGKEINIKDIEVIAKEVFTKQKIQVEMIESFNDSCAINIENVTDEQIELLKKKITEKYGIEDLTNSIERTSIPNLRLRDLIKPYIIPVIISTLIVFGFMAIRFKNIGSVKIVMRWNIRINLSRVIFIKYYCYNKISC